MTSDLGRGGWRGTGEWSTVLAAAARWPPGRWPFSHLFLPLTHCCRGTEDTRARTRLRRKTHLLLGSQGPLLGGLLPGRGLAQSVRSEGSCCLPSPAS